MLRELLDRQLRASVRVSARGGCIENEERRKRKPLLLRLLSKGFQRLEIMCCFSASDWGLLWCLGALLLRYEGEVHRGTSKRKRARVLGLALLLGVNQLTNLVHGTENSCVQVWGLGHVA